MTSIPYGFRPSKALGMVPMAPDHVAELALIEMSRMQRETLRRWNDELIVAGLFRPRLTQSAHPARKSSTLKRKGRPDEPDRT